MNTIQDTPDYPPRQVSPLLTVRQQQQVLETQIYALYCCSLGWHNWQPTVTKGKRECSVCYDVAYCPGCSLDFPRTARIARCPEHEVLS